MESRASLSSDIAPRTTNVAPRTLHSAARIEIAQRFIDALADQSVGGLFRLWIEIVAIGGVAFWALDWLPAHALQTNGGAIRPDVSGFLSALYFSAVTATSVGYGDIVPIGFARVLAIVESVAGLIIFGCVISKFVSRRQEQVIGEV